MVILCSPAYVPDEFNPQPTPIFSTPKSHWICIDLRWSPIRVWGDKLTPPPACPRGDTNVRRVSPAGPFHSGADTVWTLRGLAAPPEWNLAILRQSQGRQFSSPSADYPSQRSIFPRMRYMAPFFQRRRNSDTRRRPFRLRRCLLSRCCVPSIVNTVP